MAEGRAVPPDAARQGRPARSLEPSDHLRLGDALVSKAPLFLRQPRLAQALGDAGVLLIESGVVRPRLHAEARIDLLQLRNGLPGFLVASGPGVGSFYEDNRGGGQTGVFCFFVPMSS